MEKVQQLKVQEGDVVVVHLAHRVSNDHVGEIKKKVQECFPFDVEVLVLGESTTISVLSSQ